MKRIARRRTSNSAGLQIVEKTTRLLLRGAHADALRILRPAVDAHPQNAAILTRLGDALLQSDEAAEARGAYRRALAIDGGEFQTWYGCGMAEYSLEIFPEAIDCLRHAVALQPRDADTRFYLGASLFEMGEVDAAIDEMLLAAKRGDAAMRRKALRQVAVIIPGSPLRGNQAILRARRTWAELEKKFEGRGRVRSVRRAPGAAAEKIRVGYVSSFFARRNWMKPVWGVINHHNRSQFEIHLFADRGNPDAAVGYRAHAADAIHAITDLSNEKAAQQISAAGIDVLVDLNGYSAPERLGIYFRKPAPAVVAWFNMYATSGIPAFDYIIGDKSVIPGAEERYFTERVLRVSGSYLAFSVLYPVPEVAPPPCVRNGYVTFGCLAPQYKITGEVIGALARILREAPTARLLLKGTFLANTSNQEALLANFARHGIAPERLLLEGPEDHYKFLEAYDRVDIALDSFPYNGGTTTAEALWQGVPVLAINGDRWVARISRSILVAAGMGEWVEPSVEAYVQRAIGLARSPETSHQLASLRDEMRARLQASGACDSKGLCRELEDHYRTIVRPEQGRPRWGKPRSS